MAELADVYGRARHRRFGSGDQQTRCRVRPDQATLAGLTHCIGALPVLCWAEEHDHLVSDGPTLDRLIEKVHPPIGTMILTRWNFAEELIGVDLEMDALPRQKLIEQVESVRRVFDQLFGTCNYRPRGDKDVKTTRDTACTQRNFRRQLLP
ncbi:MAG: hypothetical protein ACI9UU_001789 [Candidatus Azotimanducaceae bacterium]|jgi:hypothetical protein